MTADDVIYGVDDRLTYDITFVVILGVAVIILGSVCLSLVKLLLTTLREHREMRDALAKWRLQGESDRAALTQCKRAVEGLRNCAKESVRMLESLKGWEETQVVGNLLEKALHESRAYDPDVQLQELMDRRAKNGIVGTINGKSVINGRRDTGSKESE